MKGYYVKNGEPTSEQSNIRSALRPVRKLYGPTPADEFSPLALKAVRDQYVEAKLSRPTINRYCGHVKRMFKWAVENEKVPVNVWHSLQAVSGLRKGRSNVPETEKVQPVDEESVQAIKPFVSEQIWAMIQLQLLTGMRPGEVVQMKMCDIDCRSSPWLYKPESHKNSHRDMDRSIPLGPKAQSIINDFNHKDEACELFSPKDVVDSLNSKRSKKNNSKKGKITEASPKGSI